MMQPASSCFRGLGCWCGNRRSSLPANAKVLDGKMCRENRTPLHGPADCSSSRMNGSSDPFIFFSNTSRCCRWTEKRQAVESSNTNDYVDGARDKRHVAKQCGDKVKIEGTDQQPVQRTDNYQSQSCFCDRSH